MYNLLIVDDEPAVVNGLAYDIDWSDMDIGEKFKAYNGTQAVELLIKNRVDIVISDIRMPELDGLELAAIIKRQWPKAKVIFMSGYNEFEYAQKAMDLGVHSYVLKPAADEEIKEAVKKAADEMDKELRDLELLARTEKQLKEAMPLMLERYLNTWIVQGAFEALKEIEKWMPEITKCKSTSPACLILVRTDDIEREDMSENIIRNLIRKILLKDEAGLIFKDPEGNHVVAVYREACQELEVLRQYIQGAAETFQFSVGRSCGATVSVFCGELIAAADFGRSYNKIISLMHRSFRAYPGVILGTETALFQPVGQRLPSLSAEPGFPLLLETLQKDKCLQRIDEIFDEVEQHTGTPYEVLLEVYFTVGNAIIQDSGKRGIPLVQWAEEEDERHFSSFESMKSLDKLKSWCKRSTEKYIDYALGQEKGSTHHLVDEAKRYMIENLHNDISLSDIASSLYVHPNYLCRRFKEEEGITISDYMTRLRMDKAKKLLRESAMKVYEVAEKAGYLSVAHFNRTFKRETGMSPKDYQAARL